MKVTYHHNIFSPLPTSHMIAFWLQNTSNHKFLNAATQTKKSLTGLTCPTLAYLAVRAIELGEGL